jgi:hypothetical protein
LIENEIPHPPLRFVSEDDFNRATELVSAFRTEEGVMKPPLKEVHMRQMFLSEVEQSNPGGAYAHMINDLRAAGGTVPQIMHLFAYKPDRTDYLSRFTQGVMRGPSPLSAGLRELIAAFTSRRNDCLF